MGIIQQMKNQKTMTERERDICNYILEHPEKVESISSRKLGHATFTSAASVTRLCQKLGMKGQVFTVSNKKFCVGKLFGLSHMDHLRSKIQPYIVLSEYFL